MPATTPQPLSPDNTKQNHSNIRTLVLTRDKQVHTEFSLEEIFQRRKEIEWFWVDFSQPTHAEAVLLEQFGFHPLAISDCLHFLQRPKLDYYDDYQFYIINAIDPKTLKPQEINLFCGEKFVVSFHRQPHLEIDDVWERMKNNPLPHSQAPGYIVYKIFDEVVDSYYPIAQKLEDRLTDLETKSMGHHSLKKRIDELFKIRRELLSLRHVVWPMRDLLYRMVNSHRLWNSEEERRHFLDIYDSLLKLSEMIESSREMTADIRDNYLSITSHRMNSIMMTLTIITIIFMPLTLIAGIYGMNFEYMPELKWKYGYFFTLGFMAAVALAMYYWFRRKGWIRKE